MKAHFERFSISMTKHQAAGASHPGPCDSSVDELIRHPQIARQLRRIPQDDLRAVLKDYGAWEDNDLADETANQRRIIWIAAGDIVDDR